MDEHSRVSTAGRSTASFLTLVVSCPSFSRSSVSGPSTDTAGGQVPTELPTSPVSETDEVETARGPLFSEPGGGCEVFLKHACMFDLVCVRLFLGIGKCLVLKDTFLGR